MKRILFLKTNFYLTILILLLQIQPSSAKTVFNPKIVDFLSGFKAIRVINNIAYCATDGGLRVYDVTDRTNPTILSNILVSESLNIDLEVKNNFAYVLSGSIYLEKSYISVVDISNPTKPKIVSRYTALEDGQVTDLLIFDHYLIVANGENVDALDLTKPKLKRVSRFQVTSPEGGVRSLALFEKTLFAVWQNLDDSALVALDLSDVTKIKKISNYFYPRLNGSPRPAGTVVTSSSTVYASVPTLGLLIFDAQKPSSLVPISRTRGVEFQGIDALYGEGGFLFVDVYIPGKTYKPGTRDLAIFDIAHGSSLALLSKNTTFASANRMDFDPDKQQTFMGIFPSKGSGVGIFQLNQVHNLDRVNEDIVAVPADVAIQQNIIFLTASQELIAGKIVQGKVKILSELGFSKNAGSIQIDGPIAYVTTYQKSKSFLNIIDISNPDDMKLLANFRLNGIPANQAQDSFAVEGAILYLAEKDGLHILDLSNPNSPKQIGFFSIAGNQGAGVIAVEKGTAYVGTLRFDQTISRSVVDFHVINVNDPRSPKLVAEKTVSRASVLTDLFVQNGFVYLMFAGFGDLPPAGDGQLAIIDVRASSPQILFSGFTRKGGTGYAEEIEIRGNTAFIADGLEGVTVLSVAVKSKPKILKTLATPGHARSVSLDEGNGIHITDGDSYLEYVVN